MDFFKCAILRGALEGVSAGDSDGESAGQSAGELNGMLGNQPSSVKTSKLGELGGLSLGLQSTGPSKWEKTWDFGWAIAGGIGR